MLVLLCGNPSTIDEYEVWWDEIVDANGPVVSVVVANHDYEAVESHYFNFVACGQSDRQSVMLAMAHTDTHSGKESGKAVWM